MSVQQSHRPGDGSPGLCSSLGLISVVTSRYSLIHKLREPSPLTTPSNNGRHLCLLTGSRTGLLPLPSSRSLPPWVQGTPFEPIGRRPSGPDSVWAGRVSRVLSRTIRTSPAINVTQIRTGTKSTTAMPITSVTIPSIPPIVAPPTDDSLSLIRTSTPWRESSTDCRISAG